jgi:H+-translocating NAD(P) transhydrogenase subunit alpha
MMSRPPAVFCRVVCCLLAAAGSLHTALLSAQDEEGSPASQLVQTVESGEETSRRSATADESPPPAGESAHRRPDLLANLAIFVLAIFVGFEVITKVPPTLHTPLMSGSNAISGITLVGALTIAGTGLWGLEPWVGFVAVILASINVVGGFAVTHRMLSMFRRR